MPSQRIPASALRGYRLHKMARAAIFFEAAATLSDFFGVRPQT